MTLYPFSLLGIVCGPGTKQEKGIGGNKRRVPYPQCIGRGEGRTVEPEGTHNSKYKKLAVYTSIYIVVKNY